MYLKSGMPYTVPQDKIDELCKAVIIANWAMLNGSFEMDVNDGYIAFKLIVPFMESIVSEKVCRYMINLSCDMVDRFNDKFQKLADSRMTLDEFKEFTAQAFK